CRFGAFPLRLGYFVFTNAVSWSHLLVLSLSYHMLVPLLELSYAGVIVF
ncbi:11611_t:CDS:1, partial [Dentiscutata heterogama]